MRVDAHKSRESKSLRETKRVLVVEDERDLAEMLVYNLERAGYAATAVFDGRAALDAIFRDHPDLVVLDWMLPEIQGTEVASRVRTNPSTASIPIIFLTARGDDVDQIVGLSLGADDYVTKPFSVKVLLARVEALLRRAGEPAAGGGPLRLGPIAVDPDTHEVKVDGHLVPLTLTEFRLLAALIQADGRVLSRARLIARAMGPGITVTERTIDVHMTAIRRKLGDAGRLIHTVRGVGYRAMPAPGATEA
jgi:two-component system phosphate regulon response regulator PhoB